MRSSESENGVVTEGMVEKKIFGSSRARNTSLDVLAVHTRETDRQTDRQYNLLDTPPNPPALFPELPPLTD